MLKKLNDYDLVLFANEKERLVTQEIEDKRKKAIEDFLSELYIDLTENKKPKHWTEEPLE